LVAKWYDSSKNLSDPFEQTTAVMNTLLEIRLMKGIFGSLNMIIHIKACNMMKIVFWNVPPVD
jgi:hypothetical protein